MEETPKEAALPHALPHRACPARLRALATCFHRPLCAALFADALGRCCEPRPCKRYGVGARTWHNHLEVVGPERHRRLRLGNTANFGKPQHATRGVGL